MKRLLVCLLLVGVVGCGESEQAQKQPSDETAQNQQHPSAETEGKAVAALEKLGATISKDDDGNVYLVSLHDSEITDADLVHLKGLPKLTMLLMVDIFGSDENKTITDAGLVHLKGLTNLRELALSSQFTDAGLVHLKGLASLRFLRLNDTQITDAGLEHLKGLTKLVSLLLNDTQITDAGLEHLEGLTSLNTLWLNETKITAGGVDRLCKALPKCEIDNEHLAAKRAKAAAEEKALAEATQQLRQSREAETARLAEKVLAEALAKKRREISLKRLEVFGEDYVGKTVRFSKVRFFEIDQSGISAFPMIQIETDGLITTYRKDEAEQWVNFVFIGDERKNCQYTLAKKERWAEFLLDLKQFDRINVEGVVVDLPSSSYFGIIVTQIEKAK